MKKIADYLDDEINKALLERFVGCVIDKAHEIVVLTNKFIEIVSKVFPIEELSLADIIFVEKNNKIVPNNLYTALLIYGINAKQSIGFFQIKIDSVLYRYTKKTAQLKITNAVKYIEVGFTIL